jgi:hypothetical protein
MYSGEDADKRRLLLFSPALSAFVLTDAGLYACPQGIRGKLNLELQAGPDRDSVAQYARGQTLTIKPEREMRPWLPSARIRRAAHRFNTFVAESYS